MNEVKVIKILGALACAAVIWVAVMVFPTHSVVWIIGYFVLILGIVLIAKSLITRAERPEPKRRDRKGLHNDRDYECKYWWGDRGGYDYRHQYCPICRTQPGRKED